MTGTLLLKYDTPVLKKVPLDLTAGGGGLMREGGGRTGGCLRVGGPVKPMVGGGTMKC